MPAVGCAARSSDCGVGAGRRPMAAPRFRVGTCSIADYAASR